MEIISGRKTERALSDPESEKAYLQLMALSGQPGYEQYIPEGVKPDATREPVKLSAESEDTVNNLLRLAGQPQQKVTSITSGKGHLSPEERAEFKRLSAKLDRLSAQGIF